VLVAEKYLREAVRILKPFEDRGTLCETQRDLAENLVVQGRLDEAERWALEARDTVGEADWASVATTTMALGLVRAAQGRDEEAEALLREALAMTEKRAFSRNLLQPLEALANFLRDRGRVDEAEEYERRLAELLPAQSPEVTTVR
jgi:tetratricopeptide (TPR) repeat protein